MDPLSCLSDAEDAINNGDLDDAQDFLDNYREWRYMGGYEPGGGDNTYRTLARLLDRMRGELHSR